MNPRVPEYVLYACAQMCVHLLFDNSIVYEVDMAYGCRTTFHSHFPADILRMPARSHHEDDKCKKHTRRAQNNDYFVINKAFCAKKNEKMPMNNRSKSFLISQSTLGIVWHDIIGISPQDVNSRSPPHDWLKHSSPAHDWPRGYSREQIRSQPASAASRTQRENRESQQLIDEEMDDFNAKMLSLWAKL